jgi:hypothetical protein
MPSVVIVHKKLFDDFTEANRRGNENDTVGSFFGKVLCRNEFFHFFVSFLLG